MADRKSSILVVEDNNGLRNSLCSWLIVEFPNCNILEAENGEEALTLASTRSPDIILMDIGLPKMNGIEATRIIKKIAPQIRIVILTFHDDIQSHTGAIEAGADFYVLKGETEKLFSVISEFLS